MDAQIINISLPAKLLALADEVAQKEARTRSELFREAIRNYVLRKSQWNEIFSYAEKKAKGLRIKPRDVDAIVSEYRKGKQ